MTYIQPNKNNNKINFIISILMISSVSMVVWGVFLYNQTVNLRYEIVDYEKMIKQEEVRSAELKNNLYSVLDPKNFEIFKGSETLVLDNHPKYVKSQSLVAGY
ncbi:hypothetical protein HZB04_03960 [Candidatus Wolfebacteria bacterium]|nr:hypothetical protein [Candidatus Wolfebacteria bacterium]